MGFLFRWVDVDKSFLKKMIEVWQPRYEEELTEEDAREIIHNITGFFSVLKEWDDKVEKDQRDE